MFWKCGLKPYMLCSSVFNLDRVSAQGVPREVSFQFRVFDQILLDPVRLSVSWKRQTCWGGLGLIWRESCSPPMRRSESSRPSRTFYRLHCSRLGCSCCSCSSVQQQQKWEVQLPLSYLVALLEPTSSFSSSYSSYSFCCIQ